MNMKVFWDVGSGVDPPPPEFFTDYQKLNPASRRHTYNISESLYKLHSKS
jgi:hypothetical protein